MIICFLDNIGIRIHFLKLFVVTIFSSARISIQLFSVFIDLVFIQLLMSRSQTKSLCVVSHIPFLICCCGRFLFISVQNLLHPAHIKRVLLTTGC